MEPPVAPKNARVGLMEVMANVKAGVGVRVCSIVGGEDVGRQAVDMFVEAWELKSLRFGTAGIRYRL